MEIGGFFDWFLEELVGIFSYCISVLGSITINGVSLLVFSVTLFCIGIFVDVMLVSFKNTNRAPVNGVMNALNGRVKESHDD